MPLFLLTAWPAHGFCADGPADAGALPRKLDAHGGIPILAWFGPPTKVEPLREMAKAGFTISFTASADLPAAMAGLDAAQQAGVKLLVSCPQMKDDPEGTVRQFRAHPALAGYFLQDEPSAAAFPELAKWVRRVRDADPDHDAYINLFPNYAIPDQLGTPTYQKYLDDFLKTVPVRLLSFDHYPVIQSPGAKAELRTQWYENLEQASAAARKAALPLWAFVLSTRHYNYPTPELSHLRVQAFSDLAYGAQTIQYFTYWQVPGSNPPFNDAPVGTDGKPTVIYERVKQVNQEIQGLSGVFRGSTVLTAGHTGDVLPAGTRRFEPQAPIQSLKTTGEPGAGAMVSLLANGSRRFLVLVNRDINAPLAASIGVDSSRVKEIVEVRKDCSLHSLKGATLETSIEPGDIFVLMWSER